MSDAAAAGAASSSVSPESPSRTLGHAASVTINRAIRVDDQGNNAMINGGG
jgi:hypothetical protein